MAALVKFYRWVATLPGRLGLMWRPYWRSCGTHLEKQAVGQRIERDHQRFRKIVRGKVKSDLSKYISRGEMIGKKGNDLVSIPLPQINVPQFRYGSKGSGGVGQGEGQPGTPLGPAQGEKSPGAGDQPGGHILEVELTLEELASILGEELALPRIEPKGKKNISSTRDRYTGIRQAGPESLRHFKRTFKRALKRQIASQSYDPARPIVLPIRADKQYRSWKEVRQPQSVAVIIYMMDVSGSMTDEQKEIVRIEAFWIDTWIKAHYQGIETVYIIHDAAAQEVDEHTFYHTRESGGTKISSAYTLADKIISSALSAGPMEHLRVPFLRRRQLGRRYPPLRGAFDRKASAEGEPLRLRAGGEPVRQRRVLRIRPRNAGRAGERRRQPHSRPRRDPRLHQGVPRDGTLMSVRYDTNLPADLRSLKQEIEGYARECGLDFYETIFEVIDAEDLNEIAAYGGFPTRYPHWSFGMAYEELKKGLRLRAVQDLRDGDQ